MSIEELVYIDETGYHYGDYPAFLAWLQGEYRGIYGADVYLEPDSQDGQFLAILAKGYYDQAALGAAVYNSFSPSTAQGVGLSRNVKINGLNRRIPTKSTADLTVVGVAGTNVTGGVAQDTLEQKWDLPALTIPGGGSITVTATAQEDGALTAEANTINRIFTPTLGWQTVNNAADASPGEPVETDAELRARQAVSTANPSLTVLDGTIGGVANVEGVTAVRGYENDTESTDSNGLPAHSICIVVEGGDSEDIAQAIQVHKTPGTTTFGSSSEIVYDSHGMPLNIKFQRPDLVTIEVEITIEDKEGYSSDYATLIKEALAAAIVASGIGNTIIYTKLFSAGYLPGTAAGGTYDIVSIEIAISGDPLASANIPLDFDEKPECDPTVDVTVVVV